MGGVESVREAGWTQGSVLRIDGDVGVHGLEVGEIVSLAAYMEVGVRIYNAPKYASGGIVSGAKWYPTRLTET